MSAPSEGKSGRAYISWALFAVAAVLFAVVAVLFIQDRRGEKSPPPPTQVAGQNQMIHVKQALEAADVSVTFAPGGARSDAIAEAGQVLEVDGATAYVFVYPSTEQREADSSTLDLAQQPLLDVRGTPIVGGPPKVFSGSNVLLLLYGGDDELSAKVQAAIGGLP